MLACVMCVCDGGGELRQMLDLPGLGILAVLSPREGTHLGSWKIR